MVLFDNLLLPNSITQLNHVDFLYQNKLQKIDDYLLLLTYLRFWLLMTLCGFGSSGFLPDLKKHTSQGPGVVCVYVADIILPYPFPPIQVAGVFFAK